MELLSTRFDRSLQGRGSAASPSLAATTKIDADGEELVGLSSAEGRNLPTDVSVSGVWKGKPPIDVSAVEKKPSILNVSGSQRNSGAVSMNMTARQIWSQKIWINRYFTNCLEIKVGRIFSVRLAGDTQLAWHSRLFGTAACPADTAAEPYLADETHTC